MSTPSCGKSAAATNSGPVPRPTPPGTTPAGIAAAGDDAARRLVIASVAARDGADQIAAALASLRTRLAEARDGGFDVADDATVSIRAGPPPLLVSLSGGDPVVARDMLTMRADELRERITDALDRLGAADADAAADISEAFAPSPIPRASATVPAGALAGSGVRRGGGMAGNEPGPNR